MKFKDIVVFDVYELAKFYIQNINMPLRGEGLSIENISKRLQWVMEQNDAYGLKAYDDSGKLAGFIMGAEELYVDGRVFRIMECCFREGFDKKVYAEFEKQLYKKGLGKVILRAVQQKVQDGIELIQESSRIAVWGE